MRTFLVFDGREVCAVAVAEVNLTGDFAIYQGDPYDLTFDFGDEDVSANTYAAQIRRYPTADEVLATFSWDMSAAATGTVVARLTGAQTVDLPLAGTWDCEETIGGVTNTIVGGRVVILRENTR